MINKAILSLTITELMQQGEIKRQIRKIYQQRRDFALNQFQAVFQDQVEIKSPLEGIAVWVKFKFPYRAEYTQLLNQLHIDAEYTQLLNQLHIDAEAHFAEQSQQSNEHFHIRFGYAAINETEISNIIRLLYEAFQHND